MRMLRKNVLTVFMLLILAAAGTAQEAKNALLIANSGYPDEIGNLPKPIPEAEALKTALESVGFTVTLVKDADKETMVETLQHFKEKTKKNGRYSLFPLRRACGAG